MKLHGSIIVTYRCNARCVMCDVWRHPSRAADEIDAAVITKLPPLFFANVTGGEPFVRQDLPDIVAALVRRSRRVVISTNGFFTERIIALCRRFPRLGIRISMEGCQHANDLIRGMPGQFERTQETLRKLREIGISDVGVAMTVQDANYQDLLSVYRMARAGNYEFATATVHNSHYFHKWDNVITQKAAVCAALTELIQELLRSPNVKEWFRAYFNHGLIDYIAGKPRRLPCEMGNTGFFLDPVADVLACNGMNQKMPMGNLRRQTWPEIWTSAPAARVRGAVRRCDKQCWMIGSVAPAMHAHFFKPLCWVLARQARLKLYQALTAITLKAPNNAAAPAPCPGTDCRERR